MIELKHNLRLAEGEDSFGQWLLDLGNGLLNDENDEVEIWPDLITCNDLVDEIIGESVPWDDLDSLGDMVLIAGTNARVLDINEQVTARIPGEARTYYSTTATR